jgi:hypothetical protein
VAPRAGLDDVEKRKFLTLPVLELRPLGRPARSQSLYRLRYPGSCEAPLGPKTRLLLLLFCRYGAPSLTRGRVCRLQFLLALASQSFLGPSPVGLVAIFYCLRFETSLFVASYDSQGHGGGIRPRYHTGTSK